jgi:hypothetical protein
MCINSRLARISRRNAFIGIGTTIPTLALRPNRAYARISAYDKKRFEELDKIDNEIVESEKLVKFNKKFPKFANKITDPDSVHTLLDIDFWYIRPLSAERKILLRYKIQRILDENNYSDEVVNLLLELLKSYDAF